VVTNNTCTFQTTHATDYAAGPGTIFVHETVNTNLDINATISLNCTNQITMNSITGTGKSDLTTNPNNNKATCIVQTNNSNGYTLEWQSNPANTGNLISTTNASDTIPSYTPQTPNTPEVWSISTNESHWGAKLGSGSTTPDTGTWGTQDNYTSNSKWLNIATTTHQIIQRTTETDFSGDNEYLFFTSEIGSSKLQPTGTYTTDVTLTATSL